MWNSARRSNSPAPTVLPPPGAASRGATSEALADARGGTARPSGRSDDDAASTAAPAPRRSGRGCCRVCGSKDAVMEEWERFETFMATLASTCQQRLGRLFEADDEETPFANGDTTAEAESCVPPDAAAGTAVAGPSAAGGSTRSAQGSRAQTVDHADDLLDTSEEVVRVLARTGGTRASLLAPGTYGVPEEFHESHLAQPKAAEWMQRRFFV